MTVSFTQHEILIALPILFIYANFIGQFFLLGAFKTEFLPGKCTKQNNSKTQIPSTISWARPNTLFVMIIILD